MRSALRDLEKRKVISLDDTLVLVRDGEGNLSRKRSPDTTVLIGALVGGIMGLLLMFMFPVIGVVFGAAAGALVGRLLSGARVDRESRADVEAALAPGSSALLALVRGGDIVSTMSKLRVPGMQVYQTTLARDTEARLREVMQ